MGRRGKFGSVFRRRYRVVGKDGSTSWRDSRGWHIRYRHKGKEVRKYAGPDRKTAIDLLDKIERELIRYEKLGEHPTNEMTVSEFAPIYLKHAKQVMTESGLSSRTSVVNAAVVPVLGALKLQDVTQLDVRQVRAAHPHWSGATWNRALGTLSSMYQHAQELGLVLDNPTKGIRRNPEPPKPLPIVSLRDQDRLVEACPEYLRPIVVAALETGCRQGELLNLEWADIDFESKTLRIRRNKSGFPLLVHMTARLEVRLRQVLAERVVPMEGRDFVFPRPRDPRGRLKKSAYDAYKRAAKTIGHPDLRWHDMRHLAAINMIRGGLDLPAVQQALGHRSLVSTYRYAQYSDGSATWRAARALERFRKSQED